MNEATGQEVVLEQDRWLKAAQLEECYQKRAEWFYNVAFLSLVNTGVILSGGDWHYVIGLGLAHLIDLFAQAIIWHEPGIASVTRVIQIGLVFVVSGLFALFGRLSRRKQQWAYITGMVLYGADGLASLWVEDGQALVFHIFVLFRLYGGLRALRQLRQLKKRNPFPPLRQCHNSDRLKRLFNSQKLFHLKAVCYYKQVLSWRTAGRRGPEPSPPPRLDPLAGHSSAAN